MAEQQHGLSTDPGKINPTGASPEALSEYQNSLEAQIKSLEDRYSNPNWFKVAAGFLQPQLGGFAASLGSASDALGENVEADRAAALPIAQMRSQLAQSRILTGQNKDISDQITKWQNEHEGETPPATLIAKWANVAPGLPAVQSMLALQKTNMEQRNLEHSQFADAMARVQFQRSIPGGQPDPADLEIISKNPSAKPAPPQPAKKQALTPEGQPATYTGTTVSPETIAYYQNIAKSGGKDAAEAQSFLDAYNESPESKKVYSPPAPSAAPTTPASAKTAEKKGPSWDDPNYPIALAPGYQGLSDTAVQEQKKANVAKAQSYLDDIAILARNPITTGRIENLKKIGSMAQDRDVQTWIARNDPSKLSSIVKNSLTSGSVPAFIADSVGKTKSILPTDGPEMVGKVQQYLQSLAKEKEYVNNLTSNPTNDKSHLIADSAVTADMKPKTVMQTVAEELHKHQRLVNLPYVLAPYAKQGYTVSDMLSSDRMREFDEQWRSTHEALPRFSEKMVLPKSLTVPQAFTPGFNQESLRK
jgi:hypothetical protein